MFLRRVLPALAFAAVARGQYDATERSLGTGLAPSAVEPQLTSEVVVYVDGEPAENIDVRFVYQRLLDPKIKGEKLARHYRTDKKGHALIEDTEPGFVHVYVFNEWSSHGTTAHVPGSVQVNLNTRNPRHRKLLAKWKRPRHSDEALMADREEPVPSVIVVGPVKATSTVEETGFELPETETPSPQ